MLRTIARGIVSGMLATGAMSATLALAKTAGLVGEPPPKKLTRRIFRRFGVPLRGRKLDAMTVLSHFGYGAVSGVLHALLPRRGPPMLGGTLFGAALWAASYMGWIPRAGLMFPPALDRPGRPTAMLLAHLVYGATLGAADRRAA